MPNNIDKTDKRAPSPKSRSATTCNTTICGAEGKMGRCLIANIANYPCFSLVGATVRDGSQNINKDCGAIVNGKEKSVLYSNQVVNAIAKSNLVIDVSVKDKVIDHSIYSAQSGSAYVCGVTGLDKQTLTELEKAGRHVPVLVSDNFSLGINVLVNVINRVSNILTDNDFDCDILESHHKHKIDAPSGTALNLAKTVIKGRSKEEGNIHHCLRQGKRKEKEINFAVRRAGGIYGEHEVMFAGEDEILYFGHRALSRSLFTKGAFSVCKWLINQEPGLYTMSNWINSLFVQK